MNNFFAIDIPFNLRHTCWFCGEPSNEHVYFPRQQDKRDTVNFIPLELPICSECNHIAKSCIADSIRHLHLQIRHQLLKKYAKTLGIGVNWTKLELEEVKLEGAAFKGFKESAWPMYEIAKQRVNFKSWDLSVDGIPLDNLDDSYFFQFEDMRFLNVDAAIDFYSKSEQLSKALLSELVTIVGKDRFGYALKITRINFDVSRKEEKQIILEIERQEYERSEMLSIQRLNQKAKYQPILTIDLIQPVTINNTIATPESIQWALSRGIDNLVTLDKFEDYFFEDHEDLGGVIAFQLYNGLQLYLEAREDDNWVVNEDPNRELWENLGKS
ncbi:TPA: hypothetical protein NKQ52_004684 [Vibrio parahaemolyticus]|nr:hypothetical protein [Vibrio parahaemolyticus]HCG8583597.1 hypothetical protein [Vibrio parahaemolyticus]HCG9752877.1 hypothetical protein [Vibrio parahaemolyticus]HCH1656972.1 hypothetical protein [Vibrio parahaemolyticus]HCH1660815.1 hypothetical protein [Vibrio parahaemolyticus]